MLESLIAKAHDDRNDVPALCRTLLDGSIIIIGEWADAEATQLRVQDFNLQGHAFIPLFSDQSIFFDQMFKTPFATKGLEVPCKSFISILHGDEILILNPGTPTAVQLSKSDFDYLDAPIGPTVIQG